MLLYYTYTGQSLRVLEAAGEVFRERGARCTRPRSSSPIRGMPSGSRASRCGGCGPTCSAVLPAQKRGDTGEIRTPDTVRDGDYDLICIGSPTWWQTVSMPMRSFLKSDEARKLLAGKPFAVFVVCRQYWLENLTAVRELAEQQGGRLRRRNPFHVSRRLVALDAVADQLSGVGGVPREVPWCPYPDDERAARSTGADPEVRRGSRGPVVRLVEVAAHASLIRRVVRIAGLGRGRPVRPSAVGIIGWIDSRRSAAPSRWTTLVVDADGTVTVTVSEDLRRGALPGMLAKLYRRDLNVRSTEVWRRDGDGRVRGHIAVAVIGAPGSGSGTAMLAPSGGGSQLSLSATVVFNVPLVGGGIESYVAAQFAEGFADIHRFTDNWIAERA